MKTNKTAIYDLIAEGKLKEALDKMKSSFRNTPEFKEIILLAGRLQNLQKKVNNKLLNHDQEEIARSQISIALLDLLETLESPEPSGEPPKKEEAASTEGSTNISDAGIVNVGGEIKIKAKNVIGRDQHSSDKRKKKK